MRISQGFYIIETGCTPAKTGPRHFDRSWGRRNFAYQRIEQCHTYRADNIHVSLLRDLNSSIRVSRFVRPWGSSGSVSSSHSAGYSMSM